MRPSDSGVFASIPTAPTSADSLVRAEMLPPPIVMPGPQPTLPWRVTITVTVEVEPEEAATYDDARALVRASVQELADHSLGRVVEHAESPLQSAILDGLLDALAGGA